MGSKLSGQWAMEGRRADGDSATQRYSGAGTAHTLNTWYLVVGIHDYTNAISKMYANGVSKIASGAFGTSGNTSDTNSLEAPTVGAASLYNVGNWYGDIAEVVIYSGAMDDTNRDNLEVSLGAKYAITVN
jgi:hypothetical protein